MSTKSQQKVNKKSKKVNKSQQKVSKKSTKSQQKVNKEPTSFAQYPPNFIMSTLCPSYVRLMSVLYPSYVRLMSFNFSSKFDRYVVRGQISDFFRYVMFPRRFISGNSVFVYGYYSRAVSI